MPNLPLSYTNVRSVYNYKERFEQTQRTINSIRDKIPNSIIFLIECSLLNENERKYLKENTDIFINLYDLDNTALIDDIYSLSKSLGEGTITIYALEYLIKNNIIFDNFYKLSGRYWLNNNFNYQIFNNDKIIIKKINNNMHNLITILYKLPKKYICNWLQFLLNSREDMKKCIGAEVLFAKFMNTMNNNDKIYTGILGCSGNIAVCGSFIEC
jgi:hypothetical protein